MSLGISGDREDRLREVPWAALGPLEEMVYGHATTAIDFGALFQLEQVLWIKLGELAETDQLGAFPSDFVHELADELIARALREAPRDPRRVADMGMDDTECELCRLLADDAQSVAMA